MSYSFWDFEIGGDLAPISRREDERTRRKVETEQRVEIPELSRNTKGPETISHHGSCCENRTEEKSPAKPSNIAFRPRPEDLHGEVLARATEDRDRGRQRRQRGWPEIQQQRRPGAPTNSPRWIWPRSTESQTLDLLSKRRLLKRSVHPRPRHHSRKAGYTPRNRFDSLDPAAILTKNQRWWSKEEVGKTELDRGEVGWRERFGVAIDGKRPPPATRNEILTVRFEETRVWMEREIWEQLSLTSL